MAKHKFNLVGIIGVGFVGGAVKRYFESQKRPVAVYDKFKKLGSAETINKADVIFISTPTPFFPSKGFDLSAVEEAAGLLAKPKIVVIKSTVLPGTTDRLQKKFSRHKFLFNPEFLREASAYRDFIKPDRQILGVTKQSRAIAKAVMNILPNAPCRKIMPAKEAEMVKYMANSFLALKVIFANEFYDICQKLGIDYCQASGLVAKDSRIGSSHLNVKQDGYRGYGGSCFPKDINAIILHASTHGAKAPLLVAMRQINRRLLKLGGLTEEYFLSGRHKNNK